jgi:hypothetical protein
MLCEYRVRKLNRVRKLCEWRILFILDELIFLISKIKMIV